MFKQQVFLAGAGIIILASLFFFGTTVAKKEIIVNPSAAVNNIPAFNIDDYIKAKEKDFS